MSLPESSSLAPLLLTPSILSLRNRLLPHLTNDPLYNRLHPTFPTSLSHALQISRSLLALRQKLSQTETEFLYLLSLFPPLPITLHHSAFIPLISALGTASQRSSLLPLCASYKIVGCYAQTELAHGSNLSGLETSATYDVSTQEFVISSNGKTGAKWWIGGAGVMATHAAVQAQLVVNGTKYGLHVFIVRLRDAEHNPLKGVRVGEIGRKAYGGFAGVDNGYISFDDVRVPRAALLARYGEVMPDGRYEKKGEGKEGLISMVRLRAGMIRNLGWSLARAVTISVRYCCERRQGGSGIETRVIDYYTTKARLWPLVARAYVFIISGRSLYETFEAGRLSAGELHLMTAAMKVRVSGMVADGCEEARKCMGGHGYHSLAGIGREWSDAVAAQTYEGDNYVLSASVASSLMKTPAQQATESSDLPTLRTADAWMDPRIQVHALLAAYSSLQFSPSRPKNHALRLTTLFADLHMLRTLPSTSTPKKLYNLFILPILQSYIPELIEADIVGQVEVVALRKACEMAVDMTGVEEVVEWCNGFCLSQWELGSVLAESDPYVGLWREVVDKPPSAGFEEELRERARDVLRAGKGEEKAKL